MTEARLVIAQASLPCEGEPVSGDAVIVRRTETRALIALVDALGHGHKAAVVAEQAVQALAELSLEKADAAGVMTELHERLRGTRGAAALVCIVDGMHVEVCGVGNVELRSVGAHVPVVLMPGILGVGVRQIRALSGTLAAGARLFVFSDGISRRAPFSELARVSPQTACQSLIERFRHSHDDASAVVVHYEEQP